MNEDAELLRRYVDQADQAAFAEIVQRHVNFVHSAALRQVNGDAHLAADVTQLVFADLARKARAVAARPVLAGWLFTSTRFAAAKLVRGEQRRRRREQEAFMREDLSRDPSAPLDWDRVRPILDDVLDELSDADREAVLLRYFENRDFAAIGAKLNLASNTARMRVDRAVEKLRERLARRGVTSTTAALAVALTNNAVLAAPTGLAASVTAPALAGAATAVGAGSLIATFMSMTKVQIALSGALVVAATTGYIVQAQSNTALSNEIAVLQQQNSSVTALRAENANLQRSAAEVATLRNDNAQFAQLGTEAKDLQARLAEATQREAEEAAAAAASSALGQTYELNALDQQPRPILRLPPSYPFEMRRAGIEGKVLVDFIVDKDGTVQNAYAAKSSRKEFEQSAVQSVLSWKFSPGRKGGRNVNTHMQVPIMFTLNNE